MSQHDYVIENAPGVSVRADINSVLQAIVTNNSAATEPATKFANMWWFDTSTSLLKRRNATNDAWIIVGLEAADIDGTLAANSDSKIATQKATKTYADTKMSKSGDETIAGVKTFSSSPIVPTPTTDYQAAPKKYIDDKTSVYVKVSEVQNNNVNAGTNVTGAWTARVINTEDNDAAGVCSISSNQITLAAGTYEVDIVSPFNYCGSVQLRLYNVSDAAVTLLGQSCVVNASAASYPAPLKGRFTIAAQKTFEIQYRTSSAYSHIGLGGACNFGNNEVYTIAQFLKVG